MKDYNGFSINSFIQLRNPKKLIIGYKMCFYLLISVYCMHLSRIKIIHRQIWDSLRRFDFANVR